ncbi:phospho-N-acetylmuramoyl-pentapeptide-transferase [Candidatus Hepatobacter penaei]|uniref:phospho-N-acetylmuramoyl-pentapeptide- transferase n=1 Tax=Candidatus Hepatobacter penaei TaxID=1274402 RepID=UPI000696C296|nr:phospho-N-acetylmuramoyl-pentapeptide-transferase [Candidatus Hepatobacter penaei]
MLYALFNALATHQGISLFGYITFRTILAFLTSFVVSFLLGPVVIRMLKTYQTRGQPIRSDGPQTHITQKKGTPTMGGLLILLGFSSAALLWGNWSNPPTWWLFFVTLAFGLSGLIDDALKLAHFNHYGLKPLHKTLVQVAFSLVAVGWLWMIFPAHLKDTLHFPFFKDALWHLSFLFPVFSMLVLIGSANAVNLTDGLDGLATGPVVICTTVLSIIVYCVGHKEFASYLHIPYVPGVGEAAVLGGALIGACLGFLWYNAPPAMIFMGDTGSMAMGGFLGGLALLAKHELIYAFIGGIFVLETLSVIVQVLYFKHTRKRIFLMAPIHHHFEAKGWSESSVVFRFWIISIILGVLGLATLKLR